MLAAEGELIAASSELEKPSSLERDHTGALFELAYINDLHGNDDVAARLLQGLRQAPGPPRRPRSTSASSTRTG